MSEALMLIVKLSGLLFVVGSMLAMGLSLTIPIILVSISNRRLMLFALLANFVLVPALAVAAAQLIDPAQSGLRTGLIIIGTAAGAPFLPKLIQNARGKLAFGVGLMVVLMVVTIIYLPIVLPILMGPGVSVNPWDIARSLILLMLIPLGIGLFIKARYEQVAATLNPIAARVSTVAMSIIMVGLLVVNFSQIIATIGTGGIIAALIFLVGSFIIGYLLGGRAEETRSGMALGTAQRNLSAAIVVAVQNFSDPNVITMVMVVSVVGLFVLMFAAGEFGRRALKKMPKITEDPDEARRIAEEAYIYAYPMIEMHKTMIGISMAKKLPSYMAPINQIGHGTQLFDDTFTAIISPNNDTLYSMGFFDLRAEPIVLSVPAIPKERYYSWAEIDMYTYVFDYVGSRETGFEAGSYLIAGPNWSGQKPDGIREVHRSETDLMMLVCRTACTGPDDIKNVLAIQQQYKVQPLSAFLGQTTPKPVPPLTLFDIPLYNPKTARSAEFITYANFVWGFAKPHPSEAELYKRFARIGMAPGAPFFADALPEGIKDAIEAGVLAGEKAIEEKSRNLGPLVNGWKVMYDGFGTRTDLKNDYLKRAGAALIGLLGNPSYEAIYPIAFVDSSGKELNGAGGARYELKFPTPPPVNAFWSVTIYRLPEKLFVKNDLKHYALGSLIPSLKKDPSGCVELFLQTDSPGKDRESNWLPAPEGPFYLILRMYWPKDEVLTGAYQPPSILKVG